MQTLMYLCTYEENGNLCNGHLGTDDDGLRQ